MELHTLISTSDKIYMPGPSDSWVVFHVSAKDSQHCVSLGVTFSTWEFHFMSADKSTPKYDMLSVSSSNTPASSYPKTIFYGCACVTLMMFFFDIGRFYCRKSSKSRT